MPGQLKAIIPPKFNSEAMMKVLETEMKKFSPFLVKDFERTVAFWKGEKPKFTPVEFKMDGVGMKLLVRVGGPKKGRDKWKWLNEGTRPHKIRPKGNYPLRFQSKYSAGSSPNSIFVMGGKKSGPEVRARVVNHPGNAARGWSILIIKEKEAPFHEWMKSAMATAARASGHQIK